LRQTDFPSSVPYYGGRLTPAVIAGLGKKEPPPIPVTGGNQPIPAPLPPPPPPQDVPQLIAAIDELHAKGVLSDEEHAQLLARVPT